MTSVFINPRTRDKNATGGIARVIEAQVKWLPIYGIDVLDDKQRADILAMHAASWVEPVSARQQLVSHCHGLYWAQDNWEHTWYQAMNEEVIDIMRKADAITVPSEWVANSIRRGSLLQVDVIGHGIELDEWEPAQDNGYVLWDKARADSVCNPRPVNVLAASMPKIRFVTTFGDETGNVRVTGEMPYDKHKLLMQHASVYLATARETFGISVLEALACGVPVVGWDWGGQAEILRSATEVSAGCGYLAPVGDYDSLKRGIEYVLAHRTEMSRAARELAESKYQWKDVVRSYAKVYERVVAERPTVKVTVVIPSYNLSAYLPAAIDSALGQDLKSKEIIVVDDCSTDGSFDIAKKYAAEYPEVTVLQTPVNSNMPGVLNLALDVCRGEYILNLDADNMLAPGALSTLCGELDKNRDLDIAYGKIRFVKDDGATPDAATSGTADGISAWPPQIASLSAQMNHRNQIPSTALVRTRLVKTLGGYRHRCFRIGEDPDFWCRALTSGAKAVRVTDAVTLVYRMRGDSRSHVQPEWAWEKWYTNKPIQIGGPINLIDGTPHVSVIIPVGPGHGRQGIEDALDSVYAQAGLSQWECIVVDDTDDGIHGSEIRWLPSWVRRYSTGRRGAGVSVARNIGIAAAKGETLLYLDGDDWLEVECLSKMYKAWRAYGGYVYCDFYKDNDGVIKIQEHTCQDQLKMLHHPITCLYPREVRELVKFDEDMRVGEDWDYILGVLSSGWCGTYLPEPLVYYRTVSGNNRKSLLDNIDAVRARVTKRWSSKMACGCGRGGNAVVAQAGGSVEQLVAAGQGGSDMVLLEFVSEGVGTMSWAGPVTGTTYRFGSGEGHRIGYVLRSDAEVLLARPEFELASVS